MDVLPTELCIRILSELPVSEAGISALIRCSLLGKSTLSAAALSPVLWKPHYECRYVHSVQTNEAQRRVTFGENWRSLYRERRKIDHEVRTALKALEGCAPRDRSEHARRVVIHGLDVWDVLTEEDRRPVPPLFQTDADVEKVKGGSPLTNLCRKYWTRELLNVIARRNAIGLWIDLMRFIAGKSDECVSFEEAYAALSSFHGVLPDEIIFHIDRQTELCKEYLDDVEVCYASNSNELDVGRLCNSVCNWMHCEGFARAENASFYDFRNSLPHLFLTTSTRSLPISLVYVFVGILKRLGIEVSPMNTPGCVTALVRDTLVDVTRSELEHGRDAVLGVMDYEVIKTVYDPRYQATLSAQLLTRAAMNIILAGKAEFGSNSDAVHLENVRGDHFLMWLRTKYLIQVLQYVFTERSPVEIFRSTSDVLMRHTWLFPLDMSLVVEDVLHPALPPLASSTREGDDHVREVPEDDRISEQLNSIFVGRIVHGGSRCIVGWKIDDLGLVTCTTLCPDNLLFHEESIPATTSLKSCSLCAITRFRENPILGQFFEDAEIFVRPGERDWGRGRLIMNKRMRSLYPDDDARAARWVREEE